MAINNLPRNNQYEIFSTGGRTYCFDDPGWENYILTKPEIFEWIRNQDPSLWHPMIDHPDSNVALYLKPELYILFKIKFIG